MRPIQVVRQVADRLLSTSLREHYIVRSLRDTLPKYFSDGITVVCFSILVVLLFLAIFGPQLAPYEADAVMRGEDGEFLRNEPPSSEHLLGTNANGHDIFSRIIIGTRYTMLIGISGGLIIVSTGLLIGVVSGYAGGVKDSVLMRLTDFMYGIPLIPTAIVLVAFFGFGMWSTVALIGLLLWRGNARVFRSQVLQIKEREHVETAKLMGASSTYIILRHILPNMMGMVILFLALGSGVTILISASLAFLGFMDPFIPSWGVMLRNAYGSGYLRSAWWWSMAPGFMITITVLSIIMLGRAYERVHDTSVDSTGGAI